MRAYNLSIEQSLLARACEAYIERRHTHKFQPNKPQTAHAEHSNIEARVQTPRQAVRSALPAGSTPIARLVGPDALRHAYSHCDQITRLHSRTFYLASALLPAPERRAVRALYAFCRVSDDLVDAVGEGRARQAHFEEWCDRALSNLPPADDPVAVAWADTRLRYRIPTVYARQLLEGVARDMQATRYANFEELAVYCYGVASTVGLMAMHIVGFSGPEAVPYAIRLGVALQITNILRDVGEDWLAGRLYLPLDELTLFGLSEQNIEQGRLDGRWKAFMRFQIARARRLYAEAWPGIGMLHPDARFAVGAAAILYEGILNDIEAHDMDVFNRRARVGTLRKLCLLPIIWYRTRR